MMYYLYKIFYEQKFTFKIAFEFSFILVKEEEISDDDKDIDTELEPFEWTIDYDLWYHSFG